MSSVGTKIILGILSGAGKTIIAILVAFVQVKLIFRFFPQDLAGIWFLFLSLAGYIAFFDLGISPTIGREISFILGIKDLTEEERHKKITDIVKTCLRIFEILAIVVFVLGLLLGGLFIWRVAPKNHLRDIFIAWPIFTIGASLNLLGGAWFASLYGLGSISTERVIRSITQLLNLFFSILVLRFGFGIIGLAVVWVGQGILERFLGWFFLNRFYPFFRVIHGQASLFYVKKIVFPSLKWAATGLGAILILQTDNVIIASTIGPAFIPQYEAVSKIISTLATFSMLIVTSSTPFLSKFFAANQTQEFNKLFYRNLRYGLSLMIIAGTFLAVFGDKVIDIWIGKGNFVGFPVLWTLLVMLTLEVHHVIHATTTMATGKIVFYCVAIIAGLLKIGLSFILVIRYGLWGIALSTMIAQLITNNWYVPYVTLRHLELSLKNYMKTILLPISALTVCCLLVNLIIKYCLHIYSNVIYMLIASLLSLVFGLLIMFFIVLTKNDRNDIVGKLGKLRLEKS